MIQPLPKKWLRSLKDRRQRKETDARIAKSQWVDMKLNLCKQWGKAKAPRPLPDGMESAAWSWRAGKALFDLEEREMTNITLWLLGLLPPDLMEAAGRGMVWSD